MLFGIIFEIQSFIIPFQFNIIIEIKSQSSVKKLLANFKNRFKIPMRIYYIITNLTIQVNRNMYYAIVYIFQFNNIIH